MLCGVRNANGTDVPGVNAERFSVWLTQRVDAVSQPLRFAVIAGGHSNLTYLVTDADGRRWVLRRPPLSNKLIGAHDMEREHRLLAAMGPTAVPVPRVVGLCVDDTVIGDNFYVTDFVEGSVIRSVADAGALTERARGDLAAHMVDVLAAIHATDLEATALSDLGRPNDYVARQLRTWLRQFEASTSRDLPSVARVHDQLAARIPPQREATLVHGDYRLDNCLATVNPPDDGRVAAVLDWEIAALGDPLADFAVFASYWTEPDDGFFPLGHDATCAAGFGTRRDLALRYAELTGRDVLEHFDYYLAFASWRLGCILEGVHARYMAGAKPDVPPEVAMFPRSVEWLVERARRLLASD